MILLRQSDGQTLSQPSQHHHNNKPQLSSNSSFYIYPCCYQISLQEKQSTSFTHQKSPHSCTMTKQSITPNDLIVIPLLGKDFSMRQNSRAYHQFEQKLLACSFCEHNNAHDKKIQFYNCYHCKQVFCSSCNFLLHSKSKFTHHQVIRLNSISSQQQNATDSSLFNCSIHQKPRKYLSKNKIICEICFRENTNKHPQQNITINSFLVEQNLSFSLQYFNQIYHNQANKLSQLKQNLRKIYKDAIEKLDDKFKTNISQVQKMQKKLNCHFTQNLSQLTKMKNELQYIASFIIFNQNQCNQIYKETINTRISLIHEKLQQIQSRCQQFMSEISYDYKIGGDKDKNFLIMLSQFLKFFCITKTKRQTSQDGMLTNRSSFKNTLKNSQTLLNRPSSTCLTTSKQNRCQSSFRKHQAISSSRKSSSFKQSGRKSLVKKDMNSDNNKKNQDMTSSMAIMKRDSLGKSISKTSSVQSYAATSSLNNSTFFKNTQRNYDVKQIQKAEYQDLNLNLKKIFDSKKSTKINSIQQEVKRISKNQSMSTSLEKANNIQQQNHPNPNHNNNNNNAKLLTKQNQKSTTSSGSFLKLFDQKKISTGRKNYFVKSSQQLPDSDTGNIIAIQTSHVSRASPDKSIQLLKRTNIKMEIFSSNRESQSSRLLLFSGNSQKSNKSKKHQNNSRISNNFMAVSGEKIQSSTISQFFLKSQNHSETKNSVEMLKTSVSKFSDDLEPQNLQKSQKFQENIKDVLMTQSVNLLQHKKETQNSVQKVVKKNKQPSVSKMYQSKQKPPQNELVFRDSTNTLKAGQKATQQKIPPAKIDKQTKPDFLDMRQRMKKPNYLSTRLSGNLIVVTINKL